MPDRVSTHRPRASSVPVRQPPRNDTAWRQFINSRVWRACSQSYLMANPLCVRCKARGLIVAAGIYHTEGQSEEHKYDWATLEGCVQAVTRERRRSEWMHERPSRVHADRCESTVGGLTPRGECISERL